MIRVGLFSWICILHLPFRQRQRQASGQIVKCLPQVLRFICPWLLRGRLTGRLSRLGRPRIHPLELLQISNMETQPPQLLGLNQRIKVHPSSQAQQPAQPTALSSWHDAKSAKFALNSKRFPRLKSTFPLWLNLQSSPRYIQNGFQPSSHFFLDRKPFALVLCLLLGWTFLNYLCRRCSNALGSRGLGMLKKLFRA